MLFVYSFVFIALTSWVHDTSCACSSSYALVDLGKCHQTCCGRTDCICNVTPDWAPGGDGTGVMRSCTYSTCVSKAVESNGCTLDANFKSYYSQLQPNVEFCNYIIDTYRCDWNAFGLAQMCMAYETCWRLPNSTCTSDCFANVMDCMIAKGCGSQMDLKTLCYQFSFRSCMNDARTQTDLCNFAVADVISRQQTGTPAPTTSDGGILVVVGVVCVLIVVAFVCGAMIMWYRKGPDNPTTSTTGGGQGEAAPINRAQDHASPKAVIQEAAPLYQNMNKYSTPSNNSITDSNIGGNTRNASKIKQQVMNGLWQKGKLLGRGASGNVYMAVLEDGSLIALKQLDVSGLSDEEVQKARNELLMVATLDHINIVRYYHASLNTHSGLLDIFMEFVQGGSLGNLVKRLDEPLNETVVRRYAKQILAGIHYLHENGIIHRDIKADNVLLNDNGCVKIADFGSAKMLPASNPATSTVVGSPYWMAPEVIVPGPTGTYSYKADVWSFGILLVELLDKGTVPYPAFDSYWDAVWAIGNNSISPQLPKHIQEDMPQAASFIRACLQRDPELRASAEDLLSHDWITIPDMLSVSSHSSHSGIVDVQPMSFEDR
eukprot:PhF_6_TR43387/c0_g1_i1/m.66588